MKLANGITDIILKLEDMVYAINQTGPADAETVEMYDAMKVETISIILKAHRDTTNLLGVEQHPMRLCKCGKTKLGVLCDGSHSNK